MKIDPDDFRVKDGKNVSLKKWPTEIKSYYETKKQFKEGLQERVDELSELQNLLYASNRFAVLLIFQAMDAAGKDSAIKHGCACRALWRPDRSCGRCPQPASVPRCNSHSVRFDLRRISTGDRGVSARPSAHNSDLARNLLRNVQTLRR